MQKLKTDELVWGKMKGFPPWPGKIMRGYAKDPPSKKKSYLYVYFFGYHNHAWIAEENIFKYLKHVKEFGDRVVHNKYFYEAVDYIHEEHWRLIELKRDPLDSGYKIDTEDELEIEEEDRKAGQKIHRLTKTKQAEKKHGKGILIAKKAVCPQNNRARKLKKKIDSEGISDVEDNCTVWPIDVNTFSSSKISSFASSKKMSCEMIPIHQDEDEDVLPSIPVNAFDDADTPIPLPSSSSRSVQFASNKQDISSFKKVCVTYNKTLGFIGLGNLSKIITKAFLKKGHTLNVWSKISNRFAALSQAGANKKHTPAEVIESSDVIFCFMPDDDISEHHRFTAEGIFDGFSRSQGIRKIYVSLTTLYQETDQDMKKAIIKLGASYFDVKALVPLANSENFSPIFVCAGHPRIYKEIKPYLDHVSRSIHYYGPKFGSSATRFLPSYLSQEVVLHAFNDAYTVFSRLGYSFPDFKTSILASNLNCEVVLKRLEDFPEGRKKLSEYLSEL